MAHSQRVGPRNYRARWIDPAGRERSRSGFTRKLDADRFLTELEHSVLSGAYVHPASSRITVGELAEQAERLDAIYRRDAAQVTAFARHRTAVVDLASVRQTALPSKSGGFKGGRYWD